MLANTSVLAPFAHVPPMYSASLTPVGSLKRKAALTPPPTLSDGLPGEFGAAAGRTVVVPDVAPQL